MNVLVTGGAGYMGCHTVADLLRESLGHLARWLKYILAFTHLTTEKGMPLREMDKIIDAVCALCCNHEKAGFVEGIKIGIRLQSELAEE